MNEENQIGYYAVIPSTVLFNENLKANEKLLYAVISVMSNKEGYCFASNSYLAKLFKCGSHTISNWISNLNRLKFVCVELIKNDKNEIVQKSVDNPIIRHQGKQINNRNIVSFDVVMEYLDRNPRIKLGNRPVNVRLNTRYISYDIIAIKENEIDNLYANIDNISSADKVIIIIQTKRYVKKNINTDRDCLICTCLPLKIIDKIN